MPSCCIHSYYLNVCYIIRFICSIDATDVPGLGKLVNDSPERFANATMKKIVISGEAHLVLFAIREINQFEELRYCYGEKNLAWRKRVGNFS